MSSCRRGLGRQLRFRGGTTLASCDLTYSPLLVLVRKLYLAGCLASRNRLLRVAISMFFRIGLEVRGICKPIPPLETILAHDAHDSMALRREPFPAARPGGDARDVDGQAGFVQRLSSGQRVVKSGVRPATTRAQRARMQSPLNIR